MFRVSGFGFRDSRVSLTDEGQSPETRVQGTSDGTDDSC